MSDKTLPTDHTMNHPIALAMQGMALWLLLAGMTALGFTLTLLVSGASLENETYVISGMTAAEVTGRAIAAALILGGISWAMLGKAFWSPCWSIILVPGLIGALVSGFAELMEWPVSYLIGGATAYFVLRIQLSQTRGVDSTNN